MGAAAAERSEQFDIRRAVRRIEAVYSQLAISRRDIPCAG
jgi:hypothetical protein